MTTPEQGSGGAKPPEELRLVQGLAPANASIPTGDAPTPGVSLAGARLPGGPTLPDWGDPSGLLLIASRMANEMFGGSAAMPATPTTSDVTTTQLATSAAPALPSSAVASPVELSPAMPTTGIAQSPSPFMAPLSFAALDDVVHPAMSIPLLDLAVPMHDSPLAMPEASAEIPSMDLPTTLVPVSYEHVPDTGIALGSTGAGTAFDPYAIRREFPILNQQVNGKRLVWLDNAATTQKPLAVIERLEKFYKTENSNIHRAAHTLAARATDAYETARETVRRFINAPSVKEIVFVRGTTEGINLVSQSWGRRNIGEGDEIVITHLEHHANIVPWQMLCAEKGAKLRVAPVDDRGAIILEEYEKLLGPKTKLVAMTQVSNALGTVTPAREMIELAHRHGAKVMLDGAQSISHMKVDVQQLDCDFFVFSGHKVFAPTGIGVVFGKQSLLDAMPPWQGGGNMIQDVTFERTVYHAAPARFEAGTGNIADAVGLGAALDWLSRIGVETVGRYEHELLEYATPRLLTVPGLTLVGTAPEKAGVLSFVLAGQKTEEVGGLLDKEGIAVRSGHHCAQPILRRFGYEATVRASLAPYNTCEDIDALVAALHRIQVGHAALR